jgi:hypothetical protein
MNDQNASAQLSILGELTAITNEYVATKMSVDDQNLYNNACNVIANDLQGLSASDMASKVKTAVQDMMDTYNIGKATFERNNMVVPCFDEVVSLGRAMQIYDKCM